MTEALRQPRAVVIARRLQVLEMEAAVQRTTLAATFAEWDQHRALTWIIGATKIARGVLGTPTAKWLLTALLLRVIRGRRA